MKKIIERNKKIILIIVIIAIVFTIGLVIFFKYNNKNKICEINKNEYNLQYDNTWKIKEEKSDEIKMLHKKSGSKLNIKIKELEDEMQYKTIDELFDSLLYNIQRQNENYKLIYKQKDQITKNNIEGYKILFETDSNQVAIYFYKQGNKIILFTYEAMQNYFDILLDSVSNIIYNFSINEQKFNVKTSINLETKSINYTKQEEITNVLKDAKQEEITSSNYLVNYSIPSNFKATDYNTQYGSYSFENLPIGTYINLKTSILKCNIYEYLNKENTTNIYIKYNLNSYNEANEIVDKFKEEPLSYIYKNSYLINNKTVENIVIIFELNNSHIMIVELCSNGIGIPEELVKMINIERIENIASNIKISKEEGFLIGKLKRFIDYTNTQTEEITLKIPENYKEIDNQNNLYNERNYVLNYNKEKQNYQYEVTYKIISSDIQNQLNFLDNSINKEYGQYKDFVKNKDIQTNNKNFEVYERAYTKLSSAKDNEGNKYKYNTGEKVLFYKLRNNSYLTIIIKANDNKITNEHIEQLTNFDINIK